MNANEMLPLKSFKSNTVEKMKIYQQMEQLNKKQHLTNTDNDIQIDKQSTPSLSTTTTKQKMSTNHPLSRNIKFNIHQNSNKTLTKSPSYSKAYYYDLTVKTVKPSPNKTIKHSRSESLYAISKEFNVKLQQKQKDAETRIKRSSTPKITTKAKAIKRDPHLFYERLYPNSKSFDDCYNHSNSDNNNSFYGTNAKHYTKFSNNNNSSVQYHNASLTFTPHINLNSKRIAAKLEKPSIRLTKRNDKHVLQYYQHHLSSELELLEKKYKKLTSPNFSMGNNGNSKDSVNYSKYISLYNKGMQMKHKRNQKCKEYKQELENQYKEFTFKPKLVPNNIYYKTSFTNNNNNRNVIMSPRKSNSINQDKANDFYNKNTKWQKSIQAKTKKILTQREKDEMSQCTFRPQINKTLMTNDTKFINKHIDQIVEYVKERRQFLLQKQEHEIYKSKIFYEQYLRPPNPKPKKHLSRQTSVCYLEEEFNSKNFNSQYK